MKTVYFFILFAVLSVTSLSQVKDTTDRRFFAFGILPANDKFVFHVDYGISIKSILYKIGYICNGNISPSGRDGSAISRDLFQSVSISLGNRYRSKAFDAWIFAGPALVWANRDCFSDPYNYSPTVGLELKTLLMFRVSNSAEFGVGCFGNLNKVKSFVGAAISVVITNGN